ncbi:hypothetical protein BJY01DRAFT_225687 [Aspergillus pseudoustus]|uniref:Uncharacterized protein n=1 Tax=Aspergillus pseudoustus TaxID=1810923 RepID=A0ABR4IY98_9EURO
MLCCVSKEEGKSEHESDSKQRGKRPCVSVCVWVWRSKTAGERQHHGQFLMH